MDDSQEISSSYKTLTYTNTHVKDHKNKRDHTVSMKLLSVYLILWYPKAKTHIQIQLILYYLCRILTVNHTKKAAV